MKKRNIFVLCIIVFMSSIFSGCNKIDDIKVKLGLKNRDFEYIKEGRVRKIVIQNTRDKGYKFVITSPEAISQLYDILSDAKVVSERSSLQPDYTFDLYEDSEVVHEFNYIVGLDKKDGGNLYSDSKNYIVPKRIDNDILKNFYDLRTPKDFNKLYYNFIGQCIDKYRLDTKNNSKSIGININDDVDVAKYILSTDLDDFKKSLSSNVYLIDDIKNKDKYDVTENINTEGYKFGSFKFEGVTYTGNYIYKSIVDFYDNKTKEEKKYYVVAIYKNSWNIKIYDKKPADF